MLKRTLLFFFNLLLSACTGLGLNLDNRRIQDEFNASKESLESRARAGEITWVTATTRTRELDKSYASRTDLDTNWKFDQDDDEYHSYCIMLAEQLDQRAITFAQFDAARIQRLNAIQIRRLSLSMQQRSSQPENSQSQPNKNKSERCLYNPSNGSYQICHHMTAGGQCVHFGAPCN